MLTDKNLLFFENAASDYNGIVELNGPAKGKIFCTANGAVSSISLALATADTAAGIGDPFATFDFTAEDVAKGVVSFCVPAEVKKFVKLTATVTGAPKEVKEDTRTGRKTGGLTAGYVPMTEEDGYIAPDMLALIK